MRTSKRVLLRRQFLPLLVTFGLVLSACGGSEDPGGGDGTGADTASPDGDATGDDGDDAGSADAEFALQYTSIFSPGSAIQDSMDWWLDEIEERSDGRIAFERFYGASLLAGTDTISGLREGRADVGYVVPAYTPGELPILNISMVPGAAGTDNQAHAQALGWLTENNQAVMDELDSQGIRIANFIIIGDLDTVMTPEPITDISQFDGLTLRAIGFISQAFELIGATPVAIEAQEAYESIERGVIGGLQSLPLESIPAQGIHEVAPWITQLRLGHFGAGSIGMSQSAYDELPDDLKAVVDEVSDEFSAQNAEITMERESEACQTVLDAGGGVTTLPDEQIEAWQDQIGDSIIEAWRSDVTAAGLSEDEVSSIEEDFRTEAEELSSSTTYVSGLTECREQSPNPES